VTAGAKIMSKTITTVVVVKAADAREIMEGKYNEILSNK
jgi:hypothetical protein